MITKEEHIKFYNAEISTQIEEWDIYQSKRMNILISEKELFIGRLWDVSIENGYVTIRFKAKEVPRLETPYFAAVIGTDATGDPSNWEFTYKEFRTSITPSYWSRKGSEITPIGFIDSDANWSYVRITLDDVEFYKFLEDSFINEGIKPLIAFAKKDPPLNYLLNLREYVKLSKPEMFDYNLESKKNPTVDVDNEAEDVSYYLNLLNMNNLLVIQGPPGTGKSYLAASICSSYLKQNKSVAICSLTNKALLEVASQEPLKFYVQEKKVYKTNLTANESKLLKGIQGVQQFIPCQGNLYLTTYYKLTDFYGKLIQDIKRFDLIVIEEASQAFLASLSMFSKLGIKTLIIGDHKQLPPVVITDNKRLLAINNSIETVINGFESLASIFNIHFYRLTKTRRITTNASKLTGIFYDNKLQSISVLNDKIVHPDKLRNVFHENGGISIVKIPINETSNFNKHRIAELISFIVKEITNDKSLKVAVLIPTIELESLFQDTFSKNKILNKNILISTVHKVQGITSDYTIYYSPLSHPFFELNNNLFNVATSRAKRGTLIITYNHIDITMKSPEISSFLDAAKNITNEFIYLSR